MPVCSILLPQEYDTPAVNVSGGHTIRYYGASIGGAFACTSTVLTIGMMLIHATHYSKPHEQKYVIRILFLIPVYALFSSISTFAYGASLYLDPLQEFYEAIALASIFRLLCSYIHPPFNVDARTTPGTWGQAICTAANKGTKWFQACSATLTWSYADFVVQAIIILVFQFVAIKASTTILTWITQAAGVYCEDSSSADFAHIWLFVIAMLSLTLCLISLLQFYKKLKPLLKQHKVVLQLVCIKTVVILDAIQPEIMKILVSKKAIKPSKFWTYGDLNVMVPMFLLCIECFVVTIMLFFAYDPRKYFIRKQSAGPEVMESGLGAIKPRYSGGFLGIVALFEALFMWDIVMDTAHAFMLVPSLFRRGKKSAPPAYQEQQRMVLPLHGSQQRCVTWADRYDADMKPIQPTHSPCNASSAQNHDHGIELVPLSKPDQIAP